MTPDLAALLYLLAFRLAVIALGALCIFCGYRLFALGCFGAEGKGSGVEVKAGKFSLSLKNAAPGAVFALFGAALAMAMLVAAPPEFVHERDGEKTLARAVESWGLAKQDREVIGDQLHRDAHVYRNDGKVREALRLADYATRLNPDDDNLWDTLAGLHADAKNFAEAAGAMETALRLQPGQSCYQRRLDRFRQGQPAPEEC